MRSNKGLWIILGSSSFALTILFIVGFGYAVWSVLHPSSSNVVGNMETPIEQAEPVADGKFQIVALGDSLTKGTGDVEGEGGYVGRLKTEIDDVLDEPVHVINFAVDGYRLDQLLADLEQTGGDQVAVQEADLIVMTIGGNDLFPVQEAFEEGITLEHVEQSMGEALEKMSFIHTELRTLNPSAPICYMGLYNPFGDVEELAQEISYYVHMWNFEVQQLLNADEQFLLIPTYDLFAFDTSTYLSSDAYHPNGAGYERIAQRVMQVLSARFGWEVEA